MSNSRDDLLKLFNVKPKETRTTPLPPTIRTQPSKPAATTALRLDEWDIAQGGKILRHNREAQETNLEPEAIADLFSLNFLTTPQLNERCTDDRRLEFVTKTIESPDYLALHRSTELNQFASELAAIELAKSFAKLKEEDEKRKDNNKGNNNKERIKAEIACDKAINKGLQKAEKQIEDLQNAIATLGCGDNAGNVTNMDVSKTAQMFQRIKDSNLLANIMEQAGRYRRVAQSKQRKKSKHGYDDVVEVMLDGNIGRLVPYELGLLATPELQMDSIRRLLEKQSICKKYKGVEKVGKGPIIVCLDESGSMSGNPIVQAKAFACAMAWIAKHQKRWCVLIGFAESDYGNCLVLPPNKWNEINFLSWLEHFYCGGTSLEMICNTLPNLYWDEFLKQGMKRGQTDLIIVTDGIVPLPTGFELFNQWREKEKVKTVSIIIGEEVGQLPQISNQTYTIDQFNLDQEAVQNCLSI